ncbi:phage tail protein [Pseudochrobactrum asaccharolyticum]|uniref:Phage tail P2-like protein n=1 Tax=Pseudochrobactrum asaccharolyticum TaxID=354351 RepID=A0A366DKF6_9HYPH|nr:phage tail protein [Pseudochrobactrum asaccharolyticum]RBO90516.1 phage tail P2-like protein [Pseudochrobactrum asaccharolyticum]
MSNRQALLPSNATALEITLSQVMDRMPEINAGIVALKGFKFDPNNSVIPYLIQEYGLEEIEEFFPIRREVITEGVKWRRLIGTPEAVHMALRWIGYRAAIEEEWVGRKKWNTFQLRFRDLPAADHPDLERIERIAEISTPLRSRFRRGVHLYDVGPLIGDCTRLNCTMLERESGVSLKADGPIWSFGRVQEIEHTLTEAEGLSLGNWIAPIEDGSLTFLDMTYPWLAATFLWVSLPTVQRQVLMASWFAGKSMHVRLTSRDGQTIGYRMCRASHAVRQRASAPYTVSGNHYEPFLGGTMLYVEAMTDFEDQSGVNAAHVSIIVGAERAAGVKPGKLWLEPDELIGGTEIVSTPVSIPLRTTVREQVKFLVRF